MSVDFRILFRMWPHLLMVAVLLVIAFFCVEIEPARKYSFGAGVPGHHLRPSARVGHILGVEILRRTAAEDYPTLDDAELVLAADQVFLDLDRREEQA